MTGVQTCALPISRNNWRRGLKILLCALAVTAATYWFDPGSTVRFGILHFLGAAALLYQLLRPLLNRFPPNPLVCLALFFAARFATKPHYNVPGLWWLGFRQPGFSSGDYFPLLPWFFMYLLGVWLGKYLAQGRAPVWLERLRCPWLEKIGRHTLLIYLLHQPLCMGLTLALVRLLGR